ncbi:MAG: hypothetical protein ACFFCS_06425 [Candidatus Hodarchaeota archaeon]
MKFKKLDYIMDKNGFISMIIYNTHPKDCIFISPKYFPYESGPWTSRETSNAYERFEYYWNLKPNKGGEGSGKVYEVDKNPLHQYKENVPDLFYLEPKYDPCHGVPMFCLPKDLVLQYYDAAGMYERVVKKPPEELFKYSSLLKIFRDNFSNHEIGITGSYLYGLYQEFSDLNLIIYDSAPIERFHTTLMKNEGLLERQDVSLTLPGTKWGGWLEEPLLLESELNISLDTKLMNHIFTYENRFIGSIHDRSNNDTRLGFWLANTRDILEHGNFKKKVLGVAMVQAKIKDWTSGMPSGNFALDKIKIIGFSPDIRVDNVEKTLDDENISGSKIKSMQIVSEFSRMFLFNEEIIAFGLLQEITIIRENKSYYELLIGGRELGGWIIPLTR